MISARKALSIVKMVPAKYLPRKPVSFYEFRLGYPIEMEHRNVTGGDPVTTARIVFAHLREVPDYYTRLLRYVERKARVRKSV